MHRNKHRYRFSLGFAPILTTSVSVSCECTVTCMAYSDLSFPVMHNVGNISIFVQLLMQINWKQLRAKLVSMPIYICYGALNLNLRACFLYQTHFQIFKQYKSANIANICVLREN